MTAQVIGRAVRCDDDVIGVAGDHLAETARFRFDREPLGAVTLRVLIGDYAAALPLTTSGCVSVWDVAAAAVAAAGTMTCQLVAADDTYAPPHVWQSETFTLTVKETLSIE